MLEVKRDLRKISPLLIHEVATFLPSMRVFLSLCPCDLSDFSNLLDTHRTHEPKVQTKFT